MATLPHLPERRQKFWSAPRERVYMQLIHWGVVVTIGAFIFILALRHELDHASVTALYGGILGHVGTAASQKFSSRSSDAPAETKTPPPSGTQI